MAHMAWFDFCEDAAHHGVLEETAEKYGINVGGLGYIVEGDVAVEGDVLGDLVVVEEAEGLEIGELGMLIWGTVRGRVRVRDLQ